MLRQKNEITGNMGLVTPNESQVGLMNNTIVPRAAKLDRPSGAESLAGGETSSTSSGGSRLTRRQLLTVSILCFVNLINYMDRFTLAGILTDIQCFFSIQDDEGGLLQTVFILSYMIFAPLFGYLGDRYSRKSIMAFGVLLWCLTTLAGSFMKDFGWFIFFRGLVGIGEASYSTIAPTIISDMFVKDMRSKMLALFYFAIPVGSGLGYITGSKMKELTGSWQWGLRVTPFMGLLAIVLIMFVMDDPPRGESEGAQLKATSWSADIKALCRNKSFMLSTLGFTCVAFVAGALAWWGPKFVSLGIAAQQKGAQEPGTDDKVAFIFGLITMLSGLLGVPLGAFVAQKLRPRWSKADPMVCAIGLLGSAPFMFFAAVMAEHHTPTAFALIFFGELFLNLNWSVVADILLYVVIPTRRSTAEAFQILISHAFGDAGSPWLIGQVSEVLKHGILKPSMEAISSSTNSTMDTLAFNASAAAVEAGPISPCQNAIDGVSVHGAARDPLVEFHSLQYALFLCVFVEVLGGLFFVMNSWFIKQDRIRAQDIIAGMDISSSDGSNSNNDPEAEQQQTDVRFRRRHTSGVVDVFVSSQQPTSLLPEESDARSLLSGDRIRRVDT